MLAKLFLYLAAGLTVLAFFLQALLRGSAPDNTSEWLAPIGPAAAAAGALAWLFDRFIWRWSLVRKMHGRPLLDGTWHGTLSSNFERDGQRIAADPDVFLVIRQRFSSVSARLLTKESKSLSVGAVLEKSPDGVYRLSHLYDNTPRQSVQHRSPIHQGAAMLNAPSHADDPLEGNYWTSRDTSGELVFPKRYRTRVESHARGRDLVVNGEPTLRARVGSRWKRLPRADDAGG